MGSGSGEIFQKEPKKYSSSNNFVIQVTFRLRQELRVVVHSAVETSKCLFLVSLSLSLSLSLSSISLFLSVSWIEIKWE